MVAGLNAETQLNVVDETKFALKQISQFIHIFS
jgi:hypothetical protein